MRTHFVVPRLAQLGAILLLATITLWPAPPAAQGTSQIASQETVVNLAAGRALVTVTKGAIIVGTVENSIESGTHPPLPVQLGATQIGIILGAVDWIAPAEKRQIARLDQELPHLRGQGLPIAPHLGSQAGMQATDIQAVGDGLFGRLNQLARGLHSKIDLPPGASIVVLIIADYLPGYGPEVWRLDYRIEQDEESPGYWVTHAIKPGYTQLWPPEKGQPRLLIEVTYPSTASVNVQESIVDLWRHKDPRLTKIAASDIPMNASARGLLEGDSNKVPPADALQFLRAALDAIAPHDARETMATLSEETGMKWILAPPVEAVKPGLQPERPSDAPTLQGPPHP